MKTFYRLCLTLLLMTAVTAQAQDVRIWDQDDATWTTEFSAGDPIDTGGGHAYNPKPVADSGNRVYVGYRQRLGSYYHIYLSRYDGNDVRIWDNDSASWTTTLGDGDPIDTGSNNSVYSPEIAIDSDDRVYMTFYQSDGAYNRIYLSRYDGVDARIWDNDSTSWTTNFSAGDPIDAATGSSASFPHLAVDSSNRVYVTFRQYSGTAYDLLYLSRYDGNDVRIWDNDSASWTTTLGDGDPIDTGSNNSVYSPEIAIDSDDRVYMTFYQSDGAYNRIYLSRYDGVDARIWDNDSTSWTTNFSAGDPIDAATGSSASFPHLAVDSSNRVYVTFRQYSGTAYDLYLSRYDGNDVRIWDNDSAGWTTNFSAGDSIDVSTNSTVNSPRLAIDGNDRVYLTYYQTTGSYSHVYLTRYNGTDVRIWDNDTTDWLTDFSAGDPIDRGDSQHAVIPKMAIDGSNRVYVTYRQNYRAYLSRYDGTNAHIWDTNTTSWTTTFTDGDPIGISTGITTYDPELAVDGNDHVFVTYFQFAGGKYHVFLNRYAPSPSLAEIDPVSALIRTTAQPFSYYINPVIGSPLAAVDQIDITVPSAYSNITVTSVRTNGISASYIDNTIGNAISVTLTTPVTNNGTILQVNFTADTPLLPGRHAFASSIDNTAAPDPLTCGYGDGDGGGAVMSDTWTVTTVAEGSVISAQAEISPVVVVMNTRNAPFSCYIEPVIGSHDTGFDTIRIDVPPVYSNVSVSGVSVGGSPAGYSDTTTGTAISVVLSNKVTVSGTDISVDFTADAPDGVDWGLDFSAMLDDSVYPDPVACVPGDGDGGGVVVTDSWTVQTLRSGNEFIQTSWLNAGQYTSRSSVYAAEAGLAVLLASNPSNLVEVFDFKPEDDWFNKQEPWCMAIYEDKLMLAMCYQPMSGGSGYLYQYDANAAAPMSVRQHITEEEGMFRIKNYDGVLYVPGMDTTLGGDANVFKDEAGVWTRYTVYDSWQHAQDIVKFRGSLYLVISGANERKSNGSDLTTWDQAGFSMGGKVGHAEVSRDKIYSTYYGGDRFRVWDGQASQARSYGEPDADGLLSAVCFSDFGEYLYIGHLENIYRYDVETDTAELSLKIDQFTYDLQEHQGRLYAAISEDDDTFDLYHPQLQGNWQFQYRANSKEDASIWSTSDGETWRKETDVPGEDRVMSLASYKGRLFVGASFAENNAAARLYASAYDPSGTLVSNPYDTELPGVVYGAISWNAEMQPDTTLKFQLRTAATEGGLGSESFIGPDGTTGTFYTAASGEQIAAGHNGERWMQYQAFLDTSDTTNRTPIFEDLTITFGTELEVANRPIGEITASTAKLNGEVILLDGTNTQVYLCWGDEDAGTGGIGAWDHAEYMGSSWVSGDTFSTNITIAASERYFYRAYISSSAGSDWADEATAFEYAHALPFHETFEDETPMAGTLGSVDGQHGWSGAPVADAVVQNADAWEFYQSAQLNDGSLRHTFSDDQTNVWIVFAWKPTQGGASFPANQLPADATAVFWSDTNGVLRAYSNQTAVSSGASVTPGEWNRFLLHNDYAAKTWSLWLDGTKIIDSFGFFSDTLTGLSEIRFLSEEVLATGLDDVQIGTAAWSPQPGDTDGDGLDDDWEVLYFHSPNIIATGTGNADGDSMTDGDEEIAGTDPMDSNSVFEVSEEGVQTGDGFIIRWPSVEGRLYSVDSRSNLLTDVWSNMESNIAPTPPLNTYTVQTDNAEILFNRVRVRKQ